MDYLKKFGLRSLRLLWLIFVIIFALAVGGNLIRENISLLEIIGSSLAGFAFISFVLLGIQYLLFGSFKLDYLFGQNTVKIVKVVLSCISIVVISGLGVRYWNEYQYNQKLIAGSDPEIFDKVISKIAIDKGTDHCYDDLPTVKKSDVRIVLAEMDKQNLQGLNKVRMLAERNDQIGLNVRCGIYTNKFNTKDLAQMFNIQY